MRIGQALNCIVERDYDLTWNLGRQRQLEVEYRNKPVLVARYVYPVSKEATAR